MPIVNRRGEPVTQLAGGALPDAPAVESPGILDTIGAAFRQNNLVVSGINEAENFHGVYNDPQAGYSAFNDIKGTPYEDHWEDFARSNNQRYTEALKHQVDGEQKDRRTLQASGWTGTIANFGANVLDPTILLPVGGEIIKGAQGGYKILDVGLRSAAAGGLSTAVQEAGLHASQYERTGEESAYAIGGGVILGGLLGSGISALLSKGERATALRGYDALLPVEGGGGLSAAPTSQSLGLDALTVDGTMAHAIADKTKALSPNLRLNFSPNKVSRQVGQELSEGTLYQVGNAEGLTTGPSVSRLAGMTERARLADGMGSLNAIYSDMKKSGINMPFADFDEAVGKAMRAEDVGENDFISQAAKAMRSKIVEPFFNDGKAVGLYEDGDGVSFAPSYFPRQYRTKVLVANENLIKPEWVAYMEKRVASTYADSATALRARHGELDAAVADLNLSPEARAAELQKVNEQRAANDTASPDHADRAASIADLRQQAKEAAAAGDDAAAREAKVNIKRLTDEGGTEFQKFTKEGAALRRRGERLAETDPEKIAARIGAAEKARARTLRAFFDRWEIRNLGENIDPFDPAILPNFKQIAKGTIDEAYDKLTGRDYGSSASVAPEYLTPITRGPVRERTLPIPDWLLTKQGVLNNRATEVLHRYSRTLAADVELTRKFGDARLDDPLKKIADEYAKLREQVATPVTPADIKMAETQPEKWAKELQARYAALDKQQRADQRDIEALRDLIRGTYKAAENGSNFGRVVRAFSHYNFVRHLGGVVISSFNDMYRPAMVHGLGRFMGDGIAPLLANAAAVKLSVKEAKLAGTVVDRVLATRLQGIAALADPMERGTPIERLMENMSKIGGTWSGINLWNDTVKSVTAIMTQNQILDGTFNTRKLAFLGIDPGMAKQIGAEFAAHGEVMDGVHIANTEKWTDQDAVRAFRAAVGKETDRIIVTPGIGDVPLFAHTPLGKLIFQFRSFMLASHQRVLLSGLQENKARFVSGMVGMSTIGMLSIYLRAWRGGQENLDRFKANAKNPGYLIGEGLDASGVFTLPFEFANTGEKLSQSYTGFAFNPIKTPMALAGRLAAPGAPVGGVSQRFSSRGPAGAALGPTAGLLIEDVPSATMGAVQALQGKEVSAAHRRAAIGLLPYNSFLGFREAAQALQGDSPYAQHSPPPAPN